MFVHTCSNLWVQNSSQFSTEMESCKAIPEVLLIALIQYFVYFDDTFSYQ